MPTVKKIGSSEKYILSYSDIIKMQAARTVLLRELEIKTQQAEKRRIINKSKDREKYRLDKTSSSVVTEGIVPCLQEIFGFDVFWYYSSAIRSLSFGCSSLSDPAECFIRDAKMLLNSPSAIFGEELDNPEKLTESIKEAFNLALNEPVLLGMVWRIYGRKWAFKEFIYTVTGMHSNSEFKLLILEDFDKERKRFERLQHKFSSEQEDEITYKRHKIPESVRREVWNRDGGKCARCDSRENLEYDHIVPVSRGGSSTARNIELLCEKCNRSKGNRIE